MLIFLQKILKNTILIWYWNSGILLTVQQKYLKRYHVLSSSGGIVLKNYHISPAGPFIESPAATSEEITQITQLVYYSFLNNCWSFFALAFTDTGAQSIIDLSQY